MKLEIERACGAWVSVAVRLTMCGRAGVSMSVQGCCECVGVCECESGLLHTGRVTRALGSMRWIWTVDCPVVLWGATERSRQGDDRGLSPPAAGWRLGRPRYQLRPPAGTDAGRPGQARLPGVRQINVLGPGVWPQKPTSHEREQAAVAPRPRA